MHTPICDFVDAYIERDSLRLHMPGHKGMGEIECRDITEIDGADVLYHPAGIIRESERNAEALFGSQRTVYSAEGSSLSIRAMLYLLRLHCGEKLRILAGRNAHKVFISAAALLDISVTWLSPAHREVVGCKLCRADLERALSQGDKPHAVYLTSPDYLGNISDIQGIAELCHENGILLLVDNAHGAYLHFLPESRHPLDLGADLCCDSAHKTLPVLTGGGYLHVSKNAPRDFAENADRAMALFASTSPSYLILQSLDRANAYLADGYRERLAEACALWDGVKQELRKKRWPMTGDEPMKLTLCPKPRGYRGDEVGPFLDRQGLTPEFYDPDYVVLMLSPEWGWDEAEALMRILLALPELPARELTPSLPEKIEQVMPPHEAIFAPCREVPLDQAVGRIAASPTVSCPPAIPIVSCGERITKQAVEVMKYYAISSVCVVER